MKFGVIYQSFDPPAVFLDYVQLIEEAGFDYLWVCDSSLHARDVFCYLTLAAMHTTRLRLGVSVHQPYNRHPGINVNGMSTVNEISGGRAMMAVGAGAQCRIARARPRAMRSLTRARVSPRTAPCAAAARPWPRRPPAAAGARAPSRGTR